MVPHAGPEDQREGSTIGSRIVHAGDVQPSDGSEDLSFADDGLHSHDGALVLSTVEIMRMKQILDLVESKKMRYSGGSVNSTNSCDDRSVGNENRTQSHSVRVVKESSVSKKPPELPRLKATEMATLPDHLDRCKDILAECGFNDLNTARAKGALIESFRDCPLLYSDALNLFKEDWQRIEMDLTITHANGADMRADVERRIQELQFATGPALQFVTTVRVLCRRFMSLGGTASRFWELVLPKLTQDVRRDLFKECFKDKDMCC